VPGKLTRRETLKRWAALCGGFAFPDGARRDAIALRDRDAHRDGFASACRAGQGCLQGARIRWIVGWTPGGGFDTYSRLVEPFAEKALGAQIAIDNMPGAGGLVGALTISRARPDGRTLGILNGSGLLWNRNPGAERNPDLADDFMLLARISQRQQVIVSHAAAGPTTLDDLLALSRRRSVVAGITAPNSSNFASLAATGDLLGLPTEYVPGYPGSRELILGLLRGDFDITCLDIESFLDLPDMDGIAPLMQITPGGSADPRIADVQHLIGPGGIVSRRPELFAADPTHVRSLTNAMSAYLGFGRLIAGPRGMAAELRDCLEQGIHTALTDPGFAAAARRAGRSIDIAPGGAVRRALPAVAEAVRAMEPVTAAAARTIR
jgi:tripartite-type tricarboxylate transporter receptor subunit TctC